MPALVAQVLDVAGQGLVDAQPVVGQQGEQRAGPQPVGLGRGEQYAELAAIEPGGLGVGADLRAAHRRGGGAVQDVLGEGVVEEPGQRRERAGDARRRGRAPRGGSGLLEMAAVGIQVHPRDRERVEVVLGAPGEERAQVTGVAAAGVLGAQRQQERRGDRAGTICARRGGAG